MDTYIWLELLPANALFGMSNNKRRNRTRNVLVFKQLNGKKLEQNLGQYAQAEQMHDVVRPYLVLDTMLPYNQE